jgi:hypothetical protein
VRSTLDERVSRVVPFRFLATIPDEFCREVSAGGKIGEHAQCGLCDVVGRPQLERSLVLVEVKCENVPGINAQTPPNLRRQNYTATYSHLNGEPFVGHARSMPHLASSHNLGRGMATRGLLSSAVVAQRASNSGPSAVEQGDDGRVVRWCGATVWPTQVPQ